jgi:SAM-dependent methyltransferase
MLEAGRAGCGFAVGQEPLPAAFAAAGVQVLATDQPPQGEAMGWIATGQHASSLENVYFPNLIDRETFDSRVSFRPVDMRDLKLPWDETFDFIWSSCSIEHLGSLEAGWQFVLHSMDLLKPGGCAVHTTEFNVASDEETLTEGSSVIYRRKDIEDLERRLRREACGLARCDYYAGDSPHDLNFDYDPYFKNGRPHIKLMYESQLTTSFLLIIQKGSKGRSVVASHAPARCEDADRRIADLESKLAIEKANAASLASQLTAIRDSTSWRVTAPLRHLKQRLSPGQR